MILRFLYPHLSYVLYCLLQVGRGVKTQLHDGDRISLVARKVTLSESFLALFLSFHLKASFNSRPDIEYPLDYTFTCYPQPPTFSSFSNPEIEFLSKYQIRQTLGTGNFGSVHLAIDSLSGDKLAIKIIERKKIHRSSSSTDKNTIMDEFTIMKEVSHPAIVEVYDCFSGQRFNFIVMK